MKKSLTLALTIFSLALLVVSESCRKKNACDNVSCNGGGTCLDGTCQCDSLHTGTNCETDKRAIYLGSHVGRITCDTLSHLDYVNITAVADTANKLNFHNLLGEEQDVKGIIRADGTIHIPTQSSGSNIISGTASIVDGKIVVHFTSAYGEVTESCNWIQQW